MSEAGRLDVRVTFERRTADANGDRTGPWAGVFTVWAGVDWMRGSEAVVASRIERRQPVQIRVRDTAQARAVDNGWRARIASGRQAGTLVNLTAVAPAREPGFLNLQGVVGEPVG